MSCPAILFPTATSQCCPCVTTSHLPPLCLGSAHPPATALARSTPTAIMPAAIAPFVSPSLHCLHPPSSHCLHLPALCCHHIVMPTAIVALHPLPLCPSLSVLSFCLVLVIDQTFEIILHDCHIAHITGLIQGKNSSLVCFQAPVPLQLGEVLPVNVTTYKSIT